jgi:hypothetical protein
VDHRDDRLRRDVERQLVLVNGELLNVFREAGGEVLPVLMERGGQIARRVGGVDPDRLGEGRLGDFWLGSGYRVSMMAWPITLYQKAGQRRINAPSRKIAAARNDLEA